MSDLEFRRKPAPDEEGDWDVYVNGELIVTLRGDRELDVADADLDPVWARLGITVTFDEPRWSEGSPGHDRF